MIESILVARAVLATKAVPVVALLATAVPPTTGAILTIHHRILDLLRMHKDPELLRKSSLLVSVITYQITPHAMFSDGINCKELCVNDGSKMRMLLAPSNRSNLLV